MVIFEFLSGRRGIPRPGGGAAAGQSLNTCPGRAVDLGVRPPKVVPSDSVELRTRLSAHESVISLHAAAEDRLRAVGLLAAGVAHEINNPAAYVLTNLEHVRTLLKSSSASGPKTAEALRALDDGIEGVQRIGDVVARLRLFARGGDELVEVVDLAEVVHGALTLASSTLRARARVELEIEQLPSIAGNRSRLALVLFSVLVNAAQACSEDERDLNVVRVALRRRGGSAEIAISDTGCGIPREVASRLFEPFFTTKPGGEHSGLGLALSRAVLDALGGSIRFETQEGVGTTFVVTVPLSAPPVLDDRTSGHFEVTAPVRPKLFLIDDEPGIRRALERALKNVAEITTARRGDEAIDLLRGGLNADVVISDLLLPGATGMEIYDFVKRERPELVRRILFMTGGAISQRTRDFMQAHSERVLSKPVDTRRLELVIRAVAGGTSVRRALAVTSGADRLIPYSSCPPPA